MGNLESQGSAPPCAKTWRFHPVEVGVPLPCGFTERKGVQVPGPSPLQFGGFFSSVPRLLLLRQSQSLTWRQCVRATSLSCCAAWQTSSPWSRASPSSSMAAAPTWTWWPAVLRRPRYGCGDSNIWWTLSPAWTKRRGWTSISRMESECEPGVTKEAGGLRTGGGVQG